jgi:hypothetical protein
VGLTLVAGPGGAPGLEDYEPSVQLYTTPRYMKEHIIIPSAHPTRQTQKKPLLSFSLNSRKIQKL